jgi:glutamate/tyrosine decarboxylase-like PLP-dependent enzyme
MNPSVAGGNHAAVHIEHQVVAWFREMLGWPDDAAGQFVSGASMATLTALAVARTRAVGRAGLDVRSQGMQGLPSRFVLYAGAEAHSCVRKAAELLGLGAEHVHILQSDEHFRVRADDLRAQIRRDRSAGMHAVAAVASVGTVNTGAIDPIDDIADVCDEHDVWLHVDGAYGAPAVALCDRYSARRGALSRVESLALDPHKWLYVPVDAGLVLVRDAEAVRDTFSLVPSYLRTDGEPSGVTGPTWFSELGFEQTRGFRALKVWMSLKNLGVDGYRALIEHDLDMAARLAARVEAERDLELIATGLSVVCFRYAPPYGERGLDELNRALLLELQLGGRSFISGTTVGGRFALRACMVNPRTSGSDIDALVETVISTGERALPS